MQIWIMHLHVSEFVHVQRLLRVLWLVSFVVARSEAFCGHSSSEHESLSRVRRSSIEVQEQRAASDADQIPQHESGERMLIDESELAQVKENADAWSESRMKSSARLDCNKSDSGALSEQTKSRSADCNTKIIETAVFIDQALSNKFIGLGSGLVQLNKLVLSIMNQVQYLFSYSSMKVPILIKLVAIEHLKDSEQVGLSQPSSERGDIDLYLSNFCNWQKRKLERDKRVWWDHAILLSG